MKILKCITLNNQPIQAGPTIVNINSNKTIYYPFNVNKCSGSSDTIDDLYAQVYISNKIKKWM